MKKIICILLLIISPKLTIGQAGTTSKPSEFESTSQLYDVLKRKLMENKVVKYDLKNVIGSPYYKDNFTSGNMLLKEKNFGRYLFKYNIYRDEVELKVNELSELESVKKIVGLRIKLDDSTLLKVVNLKKDNESQKHFVVNLVNGNYNLVKRVYVNFKTPKEAENSLTTNKKAKFTRYEEYFIKSPEKQNYSKVEKNKKKFYNLFTNNSIGIENYVKENKLNIKKEEDLIKLINFANQ
ncbi:hypothetical protein KO500_11540 [Cellulophaga baltica]|uniref:hypothetical protein n=1 Tax=Cellulophaga TaxID=104264 RepID=UPI001C068313|nr:MULTISPECIES: hypothetical protein [Cellulophaga]MBU2997072.1 hypothetical protein [Cellulophaga baltica]MDO6768470.1 hypothetical protein [Cellulophaga sp. 1_MG-2023]